MTGDVYCTGCSKLTELSAADEGSINYPRSGPYLSNEYCQWKIRAPVDKVGTQKVKNWRVRQLLFCRKSIDSIEVAVAEES